MLVKFAEQIQMVNNLKLRHRGTVVDNNDPKKLGRVKCTVPRILEGKTDNLPWCYPREQSFLGGIANSKYFAVPEMSSTLEIAFPFHDPHHPVFVGYWSDESNKVTTVDDVPLHGAAAPGVPLFDEDYPDSYGMVDSTGFWWKYNKIKKEFKFKHPSGAYISIDSDGNLKEFYPGDAFREVTGNLEVVVGGNKTETVGGDKTNTVQGKTDEIATGNHTTTAAQIHHN